MRPQVVQACVLAALALLAGCDYPPGLFQVIKTAGPQATAAPTPEELIALDRLRAHWPRPPDQAEHESVGHHLLGRFALPPTASGPRTLLVYASRRADHDCNACAPDLSFFEFQAGLAGQQPTLRLSSLAALALGYAGEPPGVQVQALGGERYAVRLTWEEFAQGSTGMLSVLVPVKGMMREVLRQEISGSHDLQIAPGQIIGVEWETDLRLDGQRVRLVPPR
ncbi:MAG: hypothetical protein RLZZ555_1729 [Pseudomonadota bacterium]|jgi:hypothetical protein